MAREYSTRRAKAFSGSLYRTLYMRERAKGGRSFLA